MTLRFTATAEAHAALRAQAAATAAAIIETRAHRFALYPRELDAIERGLSLCRPRRMRRRIAELIGEEVLQPRRYLGVGGETVMLNLRAAMVFAERLCDLETAQARSATGKFARIAP